MNQAHQKLVEKQGWYASWHKNTGHQAIHWLVFLLVGTVLTSLLVSNIDLEYKGTSAAVVTCDFYAGPNGIASGAGTDPANPWDLAFALNKGSALSGKTLCLKGGTYTGKFTSNLVGATVRGMSSSPSSPDWAKIEGYVTTTLVGNITASQTSGIVLADASKFPQNSTFTVADNPGTPRNEERIYIISKSGNTLTSVQRGRGIDPYISGHSDGATVVLGGNNLTVNGSDTIYRDFEITNSDPARSWGAYENSQDSPHYRGQCVWLEGKRTKLVNLVMHDCQDGVFSGENNGAGGDSETYGNIIYNNGYIQNTHDSDRVQLAGHGLYIQNRPEYTKTFKENIILNNNQMAAQQESVSGTTSNISNIGNVIINNNFLIGINGDCPEPQNPQVPCAFADNVTTRDSFFYSNTRGGTGGNLKMGYGGGELRSMSIINNYFGIRNDVKDYTEPASIELQSWTSAIVTGNTIVTAGASNGGWVKAMQGAVPRGGGTYTINNNTYYDQSKVHGCNSGGDSRAPFGRPNVNGVCGGALKFAEWESITGWDTDSTYSQTVAPNKVVVRPNYHPVNAPFGEPGRANIVIYNWSNAGTVTVDLRGIGLTDGQSYEIRNTAHYFTNPITGIYDSSVPSKSSAVPINMNDTEVTQPVGTSLPQRYSTMPEFGAFVVIPVSSGTPPVDTTAPVLSSGSPTGALPAGTTSANLTVSTNETATCKHGTTPNVAFASMANTFTNTNSTSHSSSLTGLTNGTSYTYYVRCRDASANANTNTSDYAITFSVANPTASPTIGISQTALSFAGVSGGATPAAKTTVITNTGSGTLNWSATDDMPWCNISPTSGQLSASASTTATVSVNNPSNVGTFTCTITVAATGATNTPQTITVTYIVTEAPDTTAPTVSITSPTSGATVSGANVTVSASASDNIGVASVQFYLDGSPLGAPDTSAPYSYSWNTTLGVSNGSHTLGAIAKDAAQNSSATASVTVNVNNAPVPVATPSFTPNGGNFTTSQSVSLATATSGASIRYTTDGSNPSSTAGTVYSGPFNLTATTTVKAIAYKSGMADSSVATATFTKDNPPAGSGLTLTPSSLTFNAVSGTVPPPSQSVVLRNTNSTPVSWMANWNGDWCALSSTSDTLAAGAQETLTVTVDNPSNEGNFACNITFNSNSGFPAPVLAVTYNVTSNTPAQVGAPTFSPPSGTSFTASQNVSLATSTSGASIRYTTDGSNPSSTTGILYSSPFTLTTTTTVKAIAYKSGSTDSAVSSATFTKTVSADPAPKITAIWLSGKTRTSGTISWKTNNVPTTGSIAFGTIRTALNQTVQETIPPTCNSNSCTHKITISNLTPNTTYYYRITSVGTGGTYTSNRYSFRTSR